MDKKSKELLEGEEVIVDEIASTEIGTERQGIEAVAANKIADEAFMEQRVTIMVYPPQQEGDLEIICPSVNGVNQPIFRGKPQTVKRKYVEALARTRTSRYTQEFHPTERDKYKMVEHKALTYPFALIKDPAGTKGQVWLDKILAER